MKSSSSITSINTSSKLKHIIQSFILSKLYHIPRALAKAKSLIIQVIENFHETHIMQISIKKNNKNYRNKNKLYVNSFRGMHYNWCSSRIMPEQIQIQIQMQMQTQTHTQQRASKEAKDSCNDDDDQEEEADSQLSGYLHWLEDRTCSCSHDDDEDLITINKEEVSEIDRLADTFIANCHEKFRLEKIDSYRKFQEMMERSL